MKPEYEKNISDLSKSAFKIFRTVAPKLSSYWHYHPEIEIVLIVKGEGIRFVGDDVSNFIENEIIIIGENIPHNYISNDNDNLKGIDTVCIQFSKGIFNNIPECRHFFRLFYEADRGIYISNPDKSLIVKILNLLRDQGIKSFTNFLEILETIHSGSEKKYIMSDKSINLNQGLGSSKRFSEVLDYIHSNYNKPISLDKISSLSHYTPNSFTRWFKKKMGMTFIEYLHEVRLTYACQLLVSRDISINQVALECGFENISTFNRLFKAKMNLSPGIYRSLK